MSRTTRRDCVRWEIEQEAKGVPLLELTKNTIDKDWWVCSPGVTRPLQEIDIIGYEANLAVLLLLDGPAIIKGVGCRYHTASGDLVFLTVLPDK